MPNDDLTRFRIVRKPEVLALIGVSSASLHRWVNEGRFPSPVKLGPNSVGWRESDLRDWLESREVVGQGEAADSDPQAHAAPAGGAGSRGSAP